MLKKPLVAILASFSLALGMLLVPAGSALAHPEPLSTASWDRGLLAQTNQLHDTVSISGTRLTHGAWGTGEVNYQAGATRIANAGSQGGLNVRLEAKDCKARYDCKYGSGSGYKGLVQFWNDPQNYVAFGLINDPGVSPTGVTVMIEGAANGKPIGGYWSAGAVAGPSHVFEFSWSANSITWNIDKQQKLGPYQIKMTNPSISFLGAAREHGDKVNIAFEGISFTGENGKKKEITVPASTPYAQISGNLQAGGNGSGYNAMLNIHDANANAIAFGIQIDQGAPESRGKPMYMFNRVQKGVFTYNYLAPADFNAHNVRIAWWKDGTTVLFADNKPVGKIQVAMQPRLFFQAEADARKNGDTLNSRISNVNVAVGDKAEEIGLNGSWNTNGPGFYNFGLKGNQVNGATQNGADFHFTGRVNGLPANGDWDSHPVYAVAMIAQYWHGK